MQNFSFVDQTIRDAQQSLWGMRMSNDMILPIATTMDQAGYKAIGVSGGRGGVVGLRERKENILERYRSLSKLITKTPLRSSVSTWAVYGFDIEPVAAIELWIMRCVANGIRSFWVCDYQMMMDRLSYLVKVVKSEGAEVVVALGYAESPVHDDALYARNTRRIAETGVDAIHIEDGCGVLTPERCRTLLPIVQKESKGTPIEFHSHCNTGLAPQNYVEGMKLGITTFHTACLPLANDTSLPSLENTVSNAHQLGFGTNIDEKVVNGISDHFRKIAQEKNMRIGVPPEYNIFQFVHQLPGGMMGTLRNQLVELHQEQRIDEVLKEIGEVRKELAYPYMGTPFSQIVGAQALFNVVAGERYKIIADEVIKYILGLYGEPDGTIDQNIKDKILSSAKAKKWLNWSVPEITIQDLRKLEPNLSDDDLLIRIANPEGEFKEKLDILYGKK